METRKKKIDEALEIDDKNEDEERKNKEPKKDPDVQSPAHP